MFNTRIAVASFAVIATAFACSQPVAEREAVVDKLATTSSASTTDACTHPICATGGPLVPSCDPCATSLCAQDPYCCESSWDATCVGEVASICGQSCTAPPIPPPDAGATTCAHPICATGAALSASCAPCATQLCAQDPYCCSTEWDATCVGEVGSICGQACN